MKKRRNNQKQYIFLFLISFSLLFGCQAALQRVRPYQPLAGETLQSPDRLVDQLKKRESSLENLKGIARLSINSPEKNLHAKEVIIMEKGLGLRMETINFFGHPTMYLVSYNNDLSVYFPLEGKFLRTRATKKNFYRWTGVNLGQEQIIKILLGITPLTGYSEKVRGIYRSEERIYLLQIENKEDIFEEIWIEADQFVPLKSLLFNSEGELVLDVTYGRFTMVQDYLLPFTIHISLPKEDTEIKIAYQKASINQNLPEDIFDLSIPNKAKEITLN